MRHLQGLAHQVIMLQSCGMSLFPVETPMASALHIGTSSRGRGVKNPSSCGAIIAAPRIKIGLFQFLATAVNSQDISANEITFKYIETGHTFMAADSVHHSIERELKKCGDVRDFQEYIYTLERAWRKVISMGATNFKYWKDHSYRATINKGDHKLSNMAVVQFRRGAWSLFYKYAHGSDSPFLTAEFLKKKSDISVLPEDRSSLRGITAQKRRYCQELVPSDAPVQSFVLGTTAHNDGAVDLINSF